MSVVTLPVRPRPSAAKSASDRRMMRRKNKPAITPLSTIGGKYNRRQISVERMSDDPSRRSERVPFMIVLAISASISSSCRETRATAPAGSRHKSQAANSANRGTMMRATTHGCTCGPLANPGRFTTSLIAATASVSTAPRSRSNMRRAGGKRSTRLTSAYSSPPANCTHGLSPPVPGRLPSGNMRRQIDNAIGGIASVMTWKWLTQNETCRRPSTGAGWGSG